MLHWADYVIFVLFLLVSIGIGIYHAFTGGKQRTNEEFIMADRKLKVLPTAISLVVSYKSSLTILGSPAEMFSYGIMLWPFTIGAYVIAGVLTSEILIPWLYPLKLTSVYAYFQHRYGTHIIKVYTTLLGVLCAVMYTGASIHAPAIAIETATGIAPSRTIPVMTLVCIIYTALGGMRAVIWTDVFQSLIMLAGQLAIMVKAFMLAGGVSKSFHIIRTEDRMALSYSADPTERHTFWSMLFILPIHTFTFHGIQQSSIQRFSAVPTLSGAKKIPLVWIFGSSLVSSIAFFTGVGLVAYYHTIGCDPVASGQIKGGNHVMPLFVVEVFKDSPGFLGLFLATLFSATLSTVSSTLSGAAANLWSDVLEPLLPNVSPRRAAAISKISVVVFGLISIGLAFLADFVKGPLVQVAVSILSVCFGPMLGLFIMAGVRKLSWIIWQGAMFGSMVGFSLMMWILLGSTTVKNRNPPQPPLSTEHCNVNISLDNVYGNMTLDIPGTRGLDKFYSLSYIYYTTTGCLTSIIVASIISALFISFKRIWKKDLKKTENDYFVAPQFFIPFKKIFCTRCNINDELILHTKQIEMDAVNSN